MVLSAVQHPGAACSEAFQTATIDCRLSFFSAADDALKEVETAIESERMKLKSKDCLCSAKSRKII